MTSTIRLAWYLALAITLAASNSTAWAWTDLFVEDFTASSSGWANYNSSAFLTHVAGGGPDGGGYASGPRSFQGLTAGNLTIILRGRHDDPFNASGDAFQRDWQADDVVELSAYVRHNFPEPLDFVSRVAALPAFPGAVFAAADPVPSNTWTKIVFDIRPTSPQLLSTEGEPWSAIFNNVGHVQLGVVVPAGHSSDATAYAFDLDKVTISTPEPATPVAGVVGLAGLLLTGRRCRRAPPTELIGS